MEYKWTALTVTVVGVLMFGIDTRIVVVGLPTVAEQLHATATEVVWITQAYVLGSAVGLLFIGRLTDIFGRVKLYNIGFVIFTIGSALASISANPSQLIGFRVVQGAGAGILVTNGAAIVTDASPKNELGFMLGINQIAIRVGAMLGLTLSGIILSLADWRALFYVNIPIGIFGTVWAHKRLREISTRDASGRLDVLGVVLFSSALSLILVAITYLSYGVSGYNMGIAMLGVGLFLLMLFVKLESSRTFPLLDLRLFKIRLFAAGNLAQLLNVTAWTGSLLLIVLYLQIGLGYSPLLAGLGFLPLEATFLVFALIAGRLSDKYGTRLLCTLGIAICTGSFFYLSTFDSTRHYYEIAVVLALMGVGNGLFASPNLRAIMGSVPPERRGIASAFRQTVNNMGLSISYGLVILFMTFGIPYDALTQLLQTNIQQSAPLAARVLFFNGFRVATLILAAINAVAVVPSVLRGGTRKQVADVSAE